MKNESQCILLVTSANSDLSIIEELKHLGKSRKFEFIHAGIFNSDIAILNLLTLSETQSSFQQFSNRVPFEEILDEEALSRILLQSVDWLYRESRGAKIDFPVFEQLDQSYHEYLNFCQFAIDVLGKVLIEYSINSVVFFNIPNYFYDTIIYQVAKARGINTLILSQSNISNFYFSLSNVEDFGKIPFAPYSHEINSISCYSMEISDNSNLHGTEQNSYGIDLKKLWLFVRLLLSQTKKNPFETYRPSYIFRLLKCVAATCPQLLGDPFARFFRVKKLAYIETLMELSTPEVKLNIDFVYFPVDLHNATSETLLGGKFSDQVFAIEELARMIPDNCLIYIQDKLSCRRMPISPMMFHRLRRIQNVILVPSDFDSNSLIDHALFVATITNIEGWEAIQKGKNVLVFGKPWYRSMPGVVEYHERISVDEVATISFEISDLEKHFGWLVSRAHSGRVGRESGNNLENLASELNAQNVAETINSILTGESDTTFQAL